MNGDDLMSNHIQWTILKRLHIILIEIESFYNHSLCLLRLDFKTKRLICYDLKCFGTFKALMTDDCVYESM